MLFSLVVDRFGYGRALWFAFGCHIVSAILTMRARGYSELNWAAFVGALGNGTVEAVINPLVATMFPREKTKWLNILHAGWPGDYRALHLTEVEDVPEEPRGLT